MFVCEVQELKLGERIIHLSLTLVAGEGKANVMRS